MDDRDDDGRRRRQSPRDLADDVEEDEAGPEGTASKTATGLRPLPPVPARFDRSQRMPAQPPTQPAQPGKPPTGRNGTPARATAPPPTGPPPPARRPPAGPVTSSGRHTIAPAPGPPTGSGRHAVVQPGEPAEPPEPAEPREATAAEVHEQRVRKIDESLTRMTAAHAGLPKGIGAVTAERDKPKTDQDDDPAAGTVGTTRRRLIAGGKILALATAVVLFVLAAAGWGTKLWLDTKIHTVAALDPTSDSIINAAGQAGDENFLLVGSDNRPGTARSDSIMVAHLPAEHTRAVVLSFPRTLEVDRPACERWDAGATAYRGEQVPDEPHSKLSEAYETGGPRCLTKVIQKLTGLSITRFIGMDLAGVKEMVDAAQGLDICVQKPVVDGVLGVVVPNAGTSKVNGARALEFVLARNVRGDPAADYGQIQRQQEFLSALLRRAASNQLALDPTAVRNFVGAFAANSIADKAGLDELLLLAQSVQGLDPASVSFRTAPTSGEANSRGNEVLRTDEANTLFTALREDGKLPDSTASGDASTAASPSSAKDAPQPGDVRLQVLNASEHSGLASQVGSSLEKLNFTVVSVGNAETHADRTVIRYSADREKQAKVLAAVVPDAAMQLVEGETGTLQLVLGASFDNIVSPLAASDESSGSDPASKSAATAGPTATCR